MKNYIQSGDLITVPAPVGGTVSGRPLAIGSLIGVAAATAAATELVTIATKGVFNLPKKAETWAVGELVYWDKVTNSATNVSSSTDQFAMGVCVEASADSVTTAGGLVRI